MIYFIPLFVLKVPCPGVNVGGGGGSIPGRFCPGELMSGDL